MAFGPGTRLGPYEILARLGAGGMGEVYRARHLRLEREVAVKVLPEHLAGDAEALARFEREAQAVAALSHPNILAIHDFGTEDGVSFAVMELLEGETLRDRMAAGPLPWRSAAELGAAIADGLAAAHAKGIVHRDLKPENVFLTADGQVKVLDFGLARRVPAALAPGSGGDAPTTPAMTSAGMLLGTVGYMSPEQARGEPAGPASDLFAFGCVLSEILTGRRPFAGRSPMETLAAVLKDEPSPPSAIEPSIPPPVDAIVRRCLEKSAASRFASARELAGALRGLLSTSPTSPTGVAASPPSRRRGPLVAVVAVAVVLAAVAFLRDGDGAAIDSLAVLPFVNASGDSEADYLSDGITESLINDLSRLREVRVVPRITVFRYKGRADDPEAVGRELDVRAVLTGRVSARGDEIVVQADLVDVASRAQIWGERFTRPSRDVVALPEDLSRRIVRALRLSLSGEELASLARRPTDDPEAYRLYLQGRFETSKLTGEGMSRGLELFRQALARDPDYALPYVGIAAYYIATNEWLLAPKDAMPQVAAAARAALERDEALGEAHAFLAMYHAWYAWDPPAAERELARALELDPDDPTSHENLGQVLATLPDRAAEAIAASRRAVELDPGSLQSATFLGFTYLLTRRYDDAIVALQKVIDRDPDYWFARLQLARVYEEVGRVDDAIVELQHAVAVEDGIAEGVAELGVAHALAGRPAEAKQVLDELAVRAETGYVAAYFRARLHLALGDVDRAFEYLEKAVDDRSLFATWLDVDPALDPLRADPRFTALRRRLVPLASG